MSTIWKTFVVLISLSLFILFLAWNFLGPVNNSSDNITFIVPQNKGSFNLADELYSNNLIKNKKSFELLFDYFSSSTIIKEGGYNLSKSMNSWEIIKNITDEQDLFWVNIYACPRKEQVGEKLAEILKWDQTQLSEWNKLNIDTDYFEGVYYPDTYLIPKDETVKQISTRFINRFNEKMAPLTDKFYEANIKWTTGVKIASLIAREAAGREDAKLISGIIWNRLNTDMRLQIDATMQYTLGKNANGSWWGAIDLKQKQLDSPYNSYRNEGLPPTPICSPNIDFIEAAISPEETDCIFYLHDSTKQIHCAKTYEEHKENIKLYL